MSKETNAGAGDSADADIVRAQPAPVAPMQTTQSAAPVTRQEIPGVTIPMPPQAGPFVPPIGGSRTIEQAEALAKDPAAQLEAERKARDAATKAGQ